MQLLLTTWQTARKKAKICVGKCKGANMGLITKKKHVHEIKKIVKDSEVKNKLMKVTF